MEGVHRWRHKQSWEVCGGGEGCFDWGCLSRTKSYHDQTKGHRPSGHGWRDKSEIRYDPRGVGGEIQKQTVANRGPKKKKGCKKAIYDNGKKNKSKGKTDTLIEALPGAGNKNRQSW